MKKALPLIIGLVVVAVLLSLVIRSGTRRTFDERVSLRHNDKAPYGTFTARKLVSDLFPKASVSFDRKMPGRWDEVSQSSYNQAAILVCREFNPDEEELFRLMHFVGVGNKVFIIAQGLSYDAREFFKVRVRKDFEEFLTDEGDSMKVSLVPPVFATHQYGYPGKDLENSFSSYDESKTVVLGRNSVGEPNLIRMDLGVGSFYVSLAPMAYTNYFLLYRNNIAYLEETLSVIPGDVEKIVWNEYFLVKPSSRNRSSNEDEDPPSPLRVLMQYPSFRWGLLTVLATIALYALMELRRRQRIIPVHARPGNDSLDFIRTLGRLYYDRRDHHNLARKMAAYFLEHVRTTYKIPTMQLDEEFVQALHFRSGYPAEELRKIVAFIVRLDLQQSIAEEQLSLFYRQLELFYQNT
jgi:hypothetical protein